MSVFKAREFRPGSLKETQRRVDLHFDRSPLGIIEWDENFQVLRCNPAAGTIFGLNNSETVNELIGKAYISLMTENDGKEHFQQLLTTDSFVSSILINRNQKNEELSFEWTSYPLG